MISIQCYYLVSNKNKSQLKNPENVFKLCDSVGNKTLHAVCSELRYCFAGLNLVLSATWFPKQLRKISLYLPT